MWTNFWQSPITQFVVNHISNSYMYRSCSFFKYLFTNTNFIGIVTFVPPKNYNLATLHTCFLQVARSEWEPYTYFSIYFELVINSHDLFLLMLIEMSCFLEYHTFFLKKIVILIICIFCYLLKVNPLILSLFKYWL